MARIKTVKIPCPECNARFISTMAVNVHLSKKHDSRNRIYLAVKGRICVRTN